MAMTETAKRVLAVAGIGAILFALEHLLPLRARRAPRLRRYLVNGAVSALALAAALVAVRPTASAMLDWSSSGSIGLLPLIGAPAAVSTGLSLLLMDLSFYYWHQANHRVPLLWRFHNVHHIDPDLDLTTAFRFHFGEIALSAGFRVVQILVIGPSLAAYALYELVFQANTLFHHSNVRIPIAVERVLNRVLVTPRMHGVHHSQVLRENRSNYGVVFPWWDELHHTLRLNVPQSKVVIGVPGYSSPRDNGFWCALSMPFRRQRDYWSAPNGLSPRRDDAELEPHPSRMAE